MTRWHAVAMVALGLVTSEMARADALAPGAPTTDFTLNDSFVTGLGQVTSLRFLPDGRLLIAEKTGALKIASADGTTVTLAGTFPVDSDSEKGILGVAVQPDFATSHRVVIYWSVAANSVDNKQRVASYELVGDLFIGDATHPEIILVENLRGPANHDGGALSFGKDGWLYVGVGDNGCNMTPPPAASGTLHQNLTGTLFNTANGKVLRVDVTGSTAGNPYVGASPVSAMHTNNDVNLPYSCAASPYNFTTIPVSATDTARPEIFAMGFRNPFRIFADPLTGFVWVGDVGEITTEEVDVITAPGQHMGWPFIEGDVTATSWPLTKCTELTPNPGNCVAPIETYSHNDGIGSNTNRSITGGVIMDACQTPTSVKGRYFYADYQLMRMWSLPVDRLAGTKTGPREDFATFAGGPVEMTVGPDGALYVALITGRIVQIAPSHPPASCSASSSSSSGGVSSSGALASSSAGSSSTVASSSSSSDASFSAGSSAAGSSSSLVSSSSSSVALSSSVGTSSSLPASSGTASSHATSAAHSSSVAGQSSSVAAVGSSSAAVVTSGSSEGGSGTSNKTCGCRSANENGAAAWLAGLMMLGAVRWRRKR